MPCLPCTIQYSQGNGSGVAQCLGNWGFCSQVVSPGHELKRLDYLLQRIEKLKTPQKCGGPRKPKEEGNVCIFKPSSVDCRPSWMNPCKRPLITFNSIEEKNPTGNKRTVRMDRENPIPGRQFILQGSDKWYKRGPSSCPQPSCPAPFYIKYPEVAYGCS